MNYKKRMVKVNESLSIFNVSHYRSSDRGDPCMHIILKDDGMLPIYAVSMLHTDKDQKSSVKRLILFDKTPPHIFLTLSCNTNWSDISK
jgi:hypothetical protein